MKVRVPKQSDKDTIVTIKDTLTFTHKLWMLSLLQSGIASDMINHIENLYCNNLKCYSKEASEDFDYDMYVLDRAIKQEEEK